MKGYAPILTALCKREGWPVPEAERTLIPGRKFRCDFVWPEQKLVCEIQGGVWMRRGGHTGGKAQLDDMAKFSLLALEGYRVIQVAPKGVTDGTLQKYLAHEFSERAA